MQQYVDFFGSSTASHEFLTVSTNRRSALVSRTGAFLVTPITLFLKITASECSSLNTDTLCITPCDGATIQLKGWLA